MLLKRAEAAIVDLLEGCRDLLLGHADRRERPAPFHTTARIAQIDELAKRKEQEVLAV